MEAPGSEPLAKGPRWLVIVARRDRDLYEHLARAFLGDDKVRVVLDRRGDERRNPPAMNERLRHGGVAVVRLTARDA